jgi:hypothetical protein
MDPGTVPFLFRFDREQEISPIAFGGNPPPYGRGYPSAIDSHRHLEEESRDPTPLT